MQRTIKRSFRPRSLLPLFVIGATVLVAYFTALKLSFYGDDWIFYDLAGRLPLSEYLTKYLDPRVQTAWYRPVQGILFLVEYYVFGADPLGYHLLNVLVHLANGLVLFRLVSRITRRPLVGFIAALAFVTWPTAVQAVLWPGVIDALETLFYLTAIWFWLNYVESERIPDFVLAFVAFLLALFTKEIGVTLPIILLLLDRLVNPRPVPFRSLVFRYLPFGLVWLGYAPIEYIVTRRSVFVNQLGYAPDLLRLLSNLIGYLATLAFPWGPFPPVSYIWLGAVALLLVYFISVRKHWALVPVVVGAVLAVLPVAAFPFVANRFLYLSLTGSAVLFALACGWLLDRVGVLRIPLLAVLAVIAALGAASISTATADFGENARVSRVPFRNVSQAHPNLPADTLLYFVYPPVPGSNLSGMFLWRYGPQVTVLASDIGRPAGLREHATAYVIYFDEQGNQKEVRVSKEIFARSSVALPADLAQSIRLQGMELANGLVTGGQSILLFTYWSALKRMETDYVISVNLVSVQNDVVARYSKAPHRGDAPTSGWTPGELVTDVVQLPVPAEMPPGVYWLELSLVDPGTGARLQLDGTGGDAISIGPVSILR